MMIQWGLIFLVFMVAQFYMCKPAHSGHIAVSDIAQYAAVSAIGTLALFCFYMEHIVW